MTGNRKLFFFICIISLVFASCRKAGEKNIDFSFEKIQEYYYQELEICKSRNLCPFYIDQNFFTDIEQTLNSLIAESDYVSVLICINMDNGIFDVCALYNKKTEIFFQLWEYSGVQKQTKIQNVAATKILKNKPKQLILIEDANLPIADSTSSYIIKKIGTETYYYAYYDHSDDLSYKSLINLFREGYESLL